MTLGSYPAAFISDETLFEATLEAELTLLLACELRRLDPSLRRRVSFRDF
jgi:hypothetical protein